MQICETQKTTSVRDACQSDFSTEKMARPWDSNLKSFGEFLHVEVRPDQKGLQVMRIGPESPLRRLRPLGSFNMHGSVESGDQIVAIDGVLIKSTAGLMQLISNRNTCEVTIYDHRTRLTVSWQLQFQEILEASHSRTRLLAG